MMRRNPKTIAVLPTLAPGAGGQPQHRRELSGDGGDGPVHQDLIPRLLGRRNRGVLKESDGSSHPWTRRQPRMTAYPLPQLSSGCRQR